MFLAKDIFAYKKIMDVCLLKYMNNWTQAAKKKKKSSFLLLLNYGLRNGTLTIHKIRTVPYTLVTRTDF